MVERGDWTCWPLRAEMVNDETEAALFTAGETCSFFPVLFHEGQ